MRYKFSTPAVLSLLLPLCVFVLLTGGCDAGNEIVPAGYQHNEPAQDSLPLTIFSGAGDEFKELVTNNSDTPQTYQLTVNSGSNPIWRLYFVATNTGANRKAMAKISLLQVPSGTTVGRNIRSSTADLSSAAGAVAGAAADDGYDEYGVPVAEQVHFDIPVGVDTYEPGAGGAADACSMHAPNDTVGDTITFNLPRVSNDSRTAVSATARLVRIVGEQRVVFWAPDAVYEGCTSGNCLPSDGLLTAVDVEELADAFLMDGDNNDIYDWVGSVFGAPWGTHDDCTDSIFISADHRKQIDILLYNIGDKPNRTVYQGGVLGYYLSGNNYSRSVYPKSNERLLLAVHTPWVKVSENYLRTLRASSQVARNQLKQRYRYRAISTLAHEYQHLIHFYQRFVLDGARSTDRDGTWLNEQFSLVAEDILYGQLASKYPYARDDRGLNNLGSGQYGICDGRIPRYLFNHGARGVSQWEGELWNYGINFSFGAYLLRNYGGIQFVKEAYGTERKNEAALSYALNKHIHGLNMGEAIRRWGVAILLSDREDASDTYRMNNGKDGFALADLGTAASYTVGSINYYNYRNSCSSSHGALRIFNTAESAFYALGRYQDGHSNVTFAVAENLNGSAQFKITLSPNQALTAVSKRIETKNSPVFYESGR